MCCMFPTKMTVQGRQSLQLVNKFLFLVYQCTHLCKCCSLYALVNKGNNCFENYYVRMVLVPCNIMQWLA